MSAMGKNVNVSLDHFSQPSWEKPSPCSAVSFPYGFCDFGFYLGVCRVAHVPFSYPGGTGDDVRNERKRNCGISRDKLRTGETSSCTQPMKVSDDYCGED